MKIEIKIPDIAENVEKGIIANVLVTSGEKVTVDQPLVELETDKATTDIPSPYDGTVKEILVKEGDEVKIHQTILILEAEEDRKTKPVKKQAGEHNDHNGERPENEGLHVDAPAVHAQAGMPLVEGKTDPSSVPASPLARKIAREFNVDITNLEGVRPGQRITRQDVENYIFQKSNSPDIPVQKSDGRSDAGDDSSYEPMSNIRRLIAKNTQEAWQTIPHVTQFDEADITLIEEFRIENSEKIAREGGKLTITAILVKITAFALQRFPLFNASIDMTGMRVIYHNNINIGIAADTPKGLLVPVIKNADMKSLADISSGLATLSGKARENKIPVDDLNGGTFTISNLGGIGGTAFTPIIYKPQVAILGVSRASMKQLYIDNEFKGRLTLPLSLSYDHRLIDGADGARFLSWIRNALEKPYGTML